MFPRHLDHHTPSTSSPAFPSLTLFFVSCMFGLMLSAFAILASPVRGQAQTPGQLTLNWQDTDSGLSGFTIQRKTGSSGTYAQIATVGPATFTYADVGLTAGSTYCYQILAHGMAGDSPPSNELCATVATATFPLTVMTGGTGKGTVVSSPSGINCTSTCSASFNSGTSVTLTASPASGSTFSGWGGACSGTGDCTVRMTLGQSVTSTFAAVPPPPATYTLSASKSGNGSGTVTSVPGGISCGSTCSASFNSGTSVTLTASPASGSAFSGWSGACSGTGDCTVSMMKAQSVKATFAKTNARKPK